MKYTKNHNPPLLKLIVFATLAYLAYYLWWRATQSLNPDALLFSWVLLFAEAFGVFNYLLFVWMTSDVSPTRPFRKAPPGIAVDVFVPTYNEDIDVLRATLVGCKNISYPHTTYVLDDGKRPEVKRLAAQLNCEYITRADGAHAKAGNLNNALRHSNGEFIVVLDADMVPQPDYIDRTLGYFEDEKLALIQLPQEFYNQDSIQHDRKRKSWHEQTLFYRVIQPGKNHSGSAFWCGSPSIVRRVALEDVGGVATETITEDIHTCVRFHSKKWKSFFLNEVLAYGIAPQTIHAFLLQRLRWAQGTMQLYRSKDNPLFIKGLSFKQRISYFASFLAYFESIQKLFLIFVPTIIILFEIFPMRVNGYLFFLHWLPYFGFTILANKVSGRGYFNFIQTEKFNLLKMVVFLQSFLILIWPKKLKFKVTPKSVENTVYVKERNSLRLYMAIFGVIVGIVVSGIVKVATGLDTSLDSSHFILALVWASLNSSLVFLGIRDVLTKRHERKQYRFFLNRSAQIYDANDYSTTQVELEDLSLFGAGLHIKSDEIPSGDDLLLHYVTDDQTSLILPIDKVYVRKRVSKEKTQVGISFGETSAVYRRRLFELLFVKLPRMLPDRGYDPGQDPTDIDQPTRIKQVDKAFTFAELGSMSSSSKSNGRFSLSDIPQQEPIKEKVN